MLSIKTRLAKLEIKSRPFAVSHWYESLIDSNDTGNNILKCVHTLCEMGVLLKPSPRVWARFHAAFDLTHLTDDELLEIVKSTDRETNAATWAILLFETFNIVPRDLDAPNARATLNDELRDQLKTIRPDAAAWPDALVERVLKDANTAMETIGPTATQKDGLAFLQNYQP